MRIFTQFLPQLPLYLLLACSALGVVIGDYFAKAWSEEQKWLFIALAFLGYIISSFFYIPTLLKEGLVVTSIIWSLLSIVGFLFVGIVLFKETLSTLQIIGVSIGIIALIILTIAE